MPIFDTDSRKHRAVLMASVAASVLSFSGVALAQDAEGEEERIVVTGSRLTGTPVSAAAPVIQVDAADLEFRGTTNIEDYVNTLPQAFAAQTSEVANGSDGTATINLRGLGSSRTLALIDGKRLPYASLFTPAANINLVPAQLVERIDVVTGGASAVYGSDAVAGVVNFVLKDDFEGFEVDVNGSFFSDGNDNALAQEYLSLAGVPIPGANTFDGWRASVSALFGANTNDGRGNVTLYFNYFQQGEMIGGDHDVGACSLGTGSGPFGAGCVGSSNFRRMNSNTGEGAFFQSLDGTLVPLVGGSAQTFNFGAFNHYQRPIERTTFYGKADYDIFENVRGYIDLQFQNNFTDAQIAPSASFNRAFRVNCDHPLLGEGLSPDGLSGRTYFDLLDCANPDPDGTVSFIHSHRNVEGLPRISTYDFATYRVMGGIDGSIFDDNVDYDVFGQFSRLNMEDISRGDLSVPNVQQALFATLDAGGNLVCTDPSNGCVPWNIFERPGGESAVTAAQTAFVQGTAITTAIIEQTVIGATVTSDLGEYGYRLPWSEDGIEILIGAEYRKDFLDRIPDELKKAGQQGLTGVGGADTELQGEVRVRELFTEVKIPLVQGVEMVQDLTLQGAYRFSDYEVEDNTGFNRSFDATTFNVGANWQFDDNIRARAQFQRAIRAPNIFELFRAVNSGLFDLPSEDPCSGAMPVASVAACAASGLDPALYGTVEVSAAGQYNQVTGGNRDLLPEVSDTITAGIVLTPVDVPELTVTVDYFNIEVTDFINAIPPTTTLELCLDTQSPQFCDLIRRDSLGTLWLQGFTADGRLAGVVATDQNIASYSTDGFDINIDYTMDLGDFDLGIGDLGQFNVNYAASYIMSLDFIDFPGAPVSECAGFYLPPCTGSGSIVGVPTPEYRHQAQFTWATSLDVDLRLTWRYFGSVDATLAPNELNETIESFNWLDIGVNWQFDENLRLRAGVNNVLDTDPPLVSDPGTGQGNNNTFPGVYPATGQYWFFGLNYRI